MNLKQFYTDTLNGGASFNITTGVYNPQKGYFVSLGGHSKVTALNKLKMSDIKSYILKNSDLFSTDYHFVGSWVDDNSNVILDVSLQFDDKRFALNFAVSQGQQAVYDANKGEVIYLPTPQLSGTYTQQRSYMTFKIDELCK